MLPRHEALALAEKKDSVVLIADGSDCNSRKTGFCCVNYCRSACRTVAAQNDAILAEYRAETKNARAAGAEATKAAVYGSRPYSSSAGDG